MEAIGVVALAEVLNNLAACLAAADAAGTEAEKDSQKAIPAQRLPTMTALIHPKRRKFFLLCSLCSDAIRT
jgi:hypothetical protein